MYLMQGANWDTLQIERWFLTRGENQTARRKTSEGSLQGLERPLQDPTRPLRMWMKILKDPHQAGSTKDPNADLQRSLNILEIFSPGYFCFIINKK